MRRPPAGEDAEYPIGDAKRPHRDSSAIPPAHSVTLCMHRPTLREAAKLAARCSNGTARDCPPTSHTFDGPPDWPRPGTGSNRAPQRPSLRDGRSWPCRLARIAQPRAREDDSRHSSETGECPSVWRDPPQKNHCVPHVDTRWRQIPATPPAAHSKHITRRHAAIPGVA